MIRDYRPQDLATIMDIGNRAWREIYEMFRTCLGDELFGLIVPDVESAKGEQIKAHCERHPEWVVVCEKGGRVVGFVCFTLHEETKIGQIGNNAVDPDCGLKGIGQQMYRAAFEYFRAHGMVYAKVRTGLDDAHARARKAYERAGFDICHQDIDYYMRL